MKFLKLLSLLIVLFSCRGENIDDIRKIDQILKIYVRNSAGVDLLNKSNTGSFYSVELKDLSALRDRVSVAATLRTDDSSNKYLEYIAGATRVLQTNSTETKKNYKSDIAVQFKATASADIVEDRMQIFYDDTSAAFQISSVTYNNVVIFTKVEGQPNIITIVK